MVDNNNNKVIENSISNTIQTTPKGRDASGGAPIIIGLLGGYDVIPKWWSSRRDAELRRYWKTSDQLSGALFTVISKIASIPFTVVAKDSSVRKHADIANEYTELLNNWTQFGEGWETFMSYAIEDLLGQDNGMFIEVIGYGNKSQAIQGPAISLSHLDSQRCTRTGDALYPVLYRDEEGRLHKLHYSRVIFASQQPSTDKLMNGVGFCAISRVIFAAQNLRDMNVYESERFGSRPPKQILLTGGGLDPDDLQDAIEISRRLMDTAGLSRYSNTVAIGDRNLDKPTLERIDLTNAPEGYEKKESTIIAMAIIALGFGVDIREIMPLAITGSAKGDAVIQNMKQRGKTIGLTIGLLEKNINKKFLPPFLKIIFDYQDDSQDRQVSEIRSTRSATRDRNMKLGVTNVRVEREQMLKDGEITLEQFKELELDDGRLESGVSVEAVFTSNDGEIQDYISGISESNYEKYKEDLMNIVIDSKSARKSEKARQCLAAIYYKFEKPIEEEEERQRFMENQTGLPASDTVDTDYDREKVDNKKPKPVTNNADEGVSEYYNDGEKE